MGCNQSKAPAPEPEPLDHTNTSVTPTPAPNNTLDTTSMRTLPEAPATAMDTTSAFTLPYEGGHAAKRKEAGAALREMGAQAVASASEGTAPAAAAAASSTSAATSATISSSSTTTATTTTTTHDASIAAAVAPPSAPLPSEVRLSGVLARKGAWGRWAERYFELRGTELRIYRKRGDAAPRATLQPIDSVTSVPDRRAGNGGSRGKGGKGARPHRIDVHGPAPSAAAAVRGGPTSRQLICLAAASAAEKTTWLVQLTAVSRLDGIEAHPRFQSFLEASGRAGAGTGDADADGDGDAAVGNGGSGGAGDGSSQAALIPSAPPAEAADAAGSPLALEALAVRRGEVQQLPEAALEAYFRTEGAVLVAAATAHYGGGGGGAEEEEEEGAADAVRKARERTLASRAAPGADRLAALAECFLGGLGGFEQQQQQQAAAAAAAAASEHASLPTTAQQLEDAAASLGASSATAAACEAVLALAELGGGGGLTASSSSSSSSSSMDFFTFVACMGGFAALDDVLVFDEFDSGRKGFLDAGDVRRMLESKKVGGGADGASDEEIAELMGDRDSTDGAGHIDFGAFRRRPG
jgi:hypothetical protein